MRLRTHLGAALTGVTLGVALTRTGFADYGEVHRMFVFRDLRLLLTFAGAVAASMIGFMVLARGAVLPRRAIHKSTIVGGAVFGIGWAITGACPAVTLVQLGNGYLPALASFGGMLAGAALCGRFRERYRWPGDSCDE